MNRPLHPTHAEPTTAHGGNIPFRGLQHRNPEVDLHPNTAYH